MSTCKHQDLPSLFDRPVQIGVTAREPVPLSLPDVAQDDTSYSPWFVSSDNYLSVLILAWTYILSARWAELMPTTCIIEYTHSLAHSKNMSDTGTDYNDQNTVCIDIDYADQAEARWWSAVLSLGQGWRATMRMAQSTFLSPWSIDFRSNLQFRLSIPLQQSSSPPNPTFSMACEYLTRFCTHHCIADQSNAALAVALLLPSVNDGRVLQLPALRISRFESLRNHQGDEALSRSTSRMHCPDRLLTLSCNIRGIRPALLSVFYEVQIECNVVTPWLQGTLAAIDTLAKKDACIIGRMCMDRSPQVAYLWLGATILGLQERLLQNVRRGQIPFDLESAVWSRTIQSFIQQPVSDPLVRHGRVTRADECRLLFLSRSERHLRIPVCQWKPFGETPIEEVDVKVRVHCDCTGEHRLQYQGLRWNSSDSTCSADQACLQPAILPATLPTTNEDYALVSYQALNRENEVISENATRNVFGWLRPDGWPESEKKVSEHHWLDMYDSESEDDDGDQMLSEENPLVPLHVKSWVGGQQISS